MNEALTLAKSWPFEQARNLLQHITRKGKQPGDTVTFQTGYGPSGRPHIGTFGEVVRTQMVRKAFELITDGAYPTRLIVFSDDLDALRKRPDDEPESMDAHIGLSLSRVPTPLISEFDSYAEQNNHRLMRFIRDQLGLYRGLHYDFASSRAFYEGGAFNDTLSLVADNHDAILKIMRDNMGDERGQTYCAFMPILEDGRVIANDVRVSTEYRDLLEFEDEFGAPLAFSIHDGNAKLQWKVDWAMRWVALDVDYEMSGKDLIESVKVSGKICRLLGGTPPLNLTYELFLDEEGAKISKSKGNGVSVDQWLQYGSRESLMYFMYQNPRSAKKIFVKMIPATMDEYLNHRRNHAGQEGKEALDNPVFHVHAGDVPEWSGDVTYQLLINLISVTGLNDVNEVLAYLRSVREMPVDNTELALDLAEMVELAIAYTHNEVLKDRTLREATDQEQAAFTDLADRLQGMVDGLPAEDYQYHVYEVGKAHGFDPLRSWFQALYEVHFGSSDGPRFGNFVSVYGVQPTVDLLRGN